MRKSWILAIVCLLPGCAAFTTGSTDCSREKAALRATDSVIAYATRNDKAGFTAQLASRGHASYHCMPGSSGQVRCSKAPVKAAGPDLSDLYHKRDALLARIAELCS